MKTRPARLADLEQAIQPVKPKLANGGIALFEKKDGVIRWTSAGGNNAIVTEDQITDLHKEGYYTILLCLDDDQEI